MWDPKGQHEKLKWGDVVPVLVPDVFVENEMVYRGCQFMKTLAQRYGKPKFTNADRVSIANPAWVTSMLIQVPYPACIHATFMHP